MNSRRGFFLGALAALAIAPEALADRRRRHGPRNEGPTLDELEDLLRRNYKPRRDYDRSRFRDPNHIRRQFYENRRRGEKYIAVYYVLDVAGMQFQINVAYFDRDGRPVSKRTYEDWVRRRNWRR